MGLIYMRVSPSGGRYIGQTIFSEEIRWKDHVKEAINPNSNNYNTILNKAIRKYGKDNFQAIILEDNIPKENLDVREIYWINYYKTYWKDNANGYNMTRGGSGHQLLQIENEDLIELWNKGYGTVEIAAYFNCERQAIKDRLLSLGYTSIDLYKRRSEQAVKTRYENHYNKEQIYSLWKDGKSITEISKQLIADRHSISRVLSQCGVTTSEKQERQTTPAVQANKRIILQYDKNNNFIQEWPSLSEAARTLHLQVSNISKVLSKERKTTGGYIFKYKGE